MFENDYLMRLIMQFIEGIMKSMNLYQEQNDPAAAADLLEGNIGNATELDGGVLLSLAPESIASVLDVSGTDPAVCEYVGRSLFLESFYLTEAGNDEKAALRLQQAQALAAHYGFDLDEEAGPESAMEAFLASLEDDDDAQASGEGDASGEVVDDASDDAIDDASEADSSESE